MRIAVLVTAIFAAVFAIGHFAWQSMTHSTTPVEAMLIAVGPTVANIALYSTIMVLGTYAVSRVAMRLYYGLTFTQNRARPAELERYIGWCSETNSETEGDRRSDRAIWSYITGFCTAVLMAGSIYDGDISVMFLVALGVAAFALCGVARITMMPKVD